MPLRSALLLALAASASAFSAPSKPAVAKKAPAANPVAAAVATAAASASLAFVLAGSPLDAHATSKTAGQISLNSLPPTSVQVNIKDLPVVGDLLSGTYTKVSDADVKSPSVVR